MDVFFFRSFSIDEHRRAIQDHVIQNNRRPIQEHVDQKVAATEQESTAVRALEKAYMKNTQAQDKESRSSDNPSCRGVRMQGEAKPLPGCHVQRQQVTSPKRAVAVGVSDSSFRPAVFDGCFE